MLNQSSLIKGLRKVKTIALHHSIVYHTEVWFLSSLPFLAIVAITMNQQIDGLMLRAMAEVATIMEGA